MEAHAPATRQAAWTILQKCVARALQYDVRVLEPGEILPLASLDQAVLAAAQALMAPLEGGWTTTQTAQVCWPVSLSGLGLGSVADAALAGRIACLAQCLPTARAHLRRILPEVDEADILSAIPLQGAADKLDGLKAVGIELTVFGTVAVGAEPRLNLYADCQPVRGLLGVVCRALATAERARLVAIAGATTIDAERRDAARIPSCERGRGRIPMGSHTITAKLATY